MSPATTPPAPGPVTGTTATTTPAPAPPVQSDSAWPEITTGLIAAFALVVAWQARGDAKRSAKAAEKSAEANVKMAEAQVEANRIHALEIEMAERHRVEDEAKATAAQQRVAQEAMRRAEMVKASISGNGTNLQITNRSGETISELRVLQVVDEHTGRCPPARPRSPTGPESVGQLRHGDSATYALAYLESGAPGDPTSTRQGADGPWAVIYRFTNDSGQRWQVIAGVMENGKAAPAPLAHQAMINDFDLTEEVEQ